MSYRSFTNKLAFIFVAILMLSSCRHQQKKLRLVFPNKINYESFIISKEKGWFYESEKSISVQTVNSGINAAEAFNTGNADMIATGNGPAAIILSNRKDAVIVCRYATGEKMHRLIAGAGIKTIGHLKGKKIGVQQGSSTHAALLAWLPQNDIPLNSISLVPMRPENMPEAMKNKQLDAIAGSEPWALNVEKLCGEAVHELSNLSDSDNCQSHILITSKTVYEKHQPQIEAVLKGLGKANQIINTNPEESAAIVSKSLGLTLEEQMICTSRLNWKLGWDDKDVQSLEATAKTLFELGRIKTIPDIAEHLISVDLIH